MTPDIEDSGSDTADVEAADILTSKNTADTMSGDEPTEVVQLQEGSSGHLIAAIRFQLDHVFLPPKVETSIGSLSGFIRDDLLNQVRSCLETFAKVRGEPEVLSSTNMVTKMVEMYRNDDALDAKAATRNIKDLQHGGKYISTSPREWFRTDPKQTS